MCRKWRVQERCMRWFRHSVEAVELVAPILIAASTFQLEVDAQHLLRGLRVRNSG